MIEERRLSTTPADWALQWVQDGHVVGLGTGRAATAFVHALARRIAQGLRVRGIPTSRVTADLATRLGIPLTSLDESPRIDVAVDGADEIDPDLNLIKGRGGALGREKIVAAAADRLIVLGSPEKLVPVLGTRGALPVEVVPFGLPYCRRRLEGLGYPAEVRTADGRPFVTDNGNHILDCRVTAIPDPRSLEDALRAIPGVVGTGLFLGMAHAALIQEGDSVRVVRPQGSAPD